MRAYNMKANEGRIGYVRIAKPDEVRAATELNVIEYEGNDKALSCNRNQR